MHGLPTEEAANVRKWAALAWLEMESAGVPPTPHNFELWFKHASGANQELSRQIAMIVETKSPITAAALNGLHATFSGSKIDVDQVVDRADAIQQAAQAVVMQVAGNGEQLRLYGDTLTHWSTRLSNGRTVENLLQAVSTLSEATARASERNRALEQQLTSAAARIARLKDSMEDLKKEATTDMLTGLCNRKAFSTRLRKAVSESKADGTPVSVLMLDVDHFKRVNDTYGHPAGDLVLGLIARLLSDSVKGRDTAARYGGEEFAVLLVKADLKAATIVANQLRMAMESRQLVKKRSPDDHGRITVSVGVAQFRSNETIASLLDRTDAALYQAKALGRNQVCAAQ
jgi:diguanylate cyclase